ncbi:hypothetical protein J6590_004634 [Homalodisca vitripennis]|nr:hypothetical protein J6590_004634 [Homalodisca vitripennis]
MLLETVWETSSLSNKSTFLGLQDFIGKQVVTLKILTFSASKQICGETTIRSNWSLTTWELIQIIHLGPHGVFSATIKPPKNHLRRPEWSVDLTSSSGGPPPSPTDVERNVPTICDLMTIITLPVYGAPSQRPSDPPPPSHEDVIAGRILFRQIAKNKSPGEIYELGVALYRRCRSGLRERNYRLANLGEVFRARQWLQKGEKFLSVLRFRLKNSLDVL